MNSRRHRRRFAASRLRSAATLPSFATECGRSPIELIMRHTKGSSFSGLMLRRPWIWESRGWPRVRLALLASISAERARSLIAPRSVAQELAAALRAERDEIEPGAAARAPGAQGPEGAEKSLSGARDQMNRASRELEHARDPARAGQSLPAAKQAMLQAARDLQAAALLAGTSADSGYAGFGEGDDPPGPSDGQAQADASADGLVLDPESRPSGAVEPDLTKLKELVRQKTGRKWGELPGHLRNEILQMRGGRYRDDYARMIQLYFREIAGAATTESEEKKD